MRSQKDMDRLDAFIARVGARLYKPGRKRPLSDCLLALAEYRSGQTLKAIGRSRGLSHSMARLIVFYARAHRLTEGGRKG